MTDPCHQEDAEIDKALGEDWPRKKNMSPEATRFVQVHTDGGRRTQRLSDEFALRLLQKQYGDETGLRFFIGLATGKSKCASVGASMIEFRGVPIE